MKKIFPLFLLFSLIPIQTSFASPTTTSPLSLKIPFTSETPDGKWVAPWNNACEEASVSMVEQFYLKNTRKISSKEWKEKMLPLFEWETKNLGFHQDTNAEETAKLINEHSAFSAVVKKDPSLQSIKEQLIAGHPVITLHAGFELKNPHIPFRRSGSGYHMLVLKGFDDSKKEFITNDPGTNLGLDYRYTYDTILNTLHDFNHTTRQANGDAVALFTKEVLLVKTTTSPAVYLIQDKQKLPLASSLVLKNHNWPWSLVRRVSSEWLETFSTSTLLTK
jgi:uncharacterized protein YvpB